jgi:hypothetical protein
MRNPARAVDASRVPLSQRADPVAGNIFCQGRHRLRFNPLDRCDGAREGPEVVALACRLRRRRPKGWQLSLREVSKELAARGYLNERDKPYAAKSVASMLA